MEINITKFYNEACARDYSASVAEIGNNAGADTWRAAWEDAPVYNLLDDSDTLDAMRAWAESSGGWNDAEIAAWTDIELNALFIQLVSGDLREKGGMNWDEYQEASEQGQLSGCLFAGIDGAIYYYLGD